MTAAVNDIQKKIGAVAAIEKMLSAVAYNASHVLTKESDARLAGGALFYIESAPGEGSAPIFCGFFVSPRIALSISHDEVFAAWRKTPSIVLHGRCPALPERVFEFGIVSVDFDKDFSVLRLVGEADAPAFFDVPRFSSVTAGIELGLVTMSIGSSTMLKVGPQVSQHRVNVSRIAESHFLYDGASTWRGDSGGALLFEEGCVVGLHLEVVDDKPELAPVGGGGGGVKKDSLVKLRKDFGGIARALDSVSEAASSASKVCRALLLTHKDVLDAIDAAEAGVAPA